MRLRHLARWCGRHRRHVFAAWLLVLLVGIVGAPALFGRLSSEVGTASGSESHRAAQLLHRIAPTGDEIFAVIDGRPVADPALRADVLAAATSIRAIPGVQSVTTPWSGPSTTVTAPALVARDGNGVAVAVQFVPHRPGAGEVHASAARLRAIPAPKVLVGGGPLQDDEMDSAAAGDLQHAETLSMPVVLLLLLLLFGGAVAAALPVVLALVGVAATLAGLLAVSLLGDVSVYSINVVTMLGLGLSVDYALLIVSRFREERGGEGSTVGVAEALEATFATAGRTVLFSGLTVATSLGGLLVFPDDFLRSMGFAGLCVVLLAMLAALTLLPALLSLVGSRIRPPRHAECQGRLFLQVSAAVRRRPVVVALAVAALLTLAAVPFAGVRFANPDARSLPAHAPSRQLQELATSRFPAVETPEPIVVVSAQPLSSSARTAVADDLRRRNGVASVSPRPGMTERAVFDVVPSGTSQGPTAMRLVRQIRSDLHPQGFVVTGDAAELTDYSAALRGALPRAVAIILLATFGLLFLFTGSLVVPVKAILTNLLSLGASFGALVWVFQDGHLGGLVGTQALGSLSVTTPVLVFAIAFGLSMDYEVFLLGRIAETYRATGDNDRAVARGLQSTGRVVTTAALLIAVVFAGFVAGGFSPVKQVGLGLVLAVVLDATLVRMLLVPAVMFLMGDRNWWAPVPLRRLHARIGLSEPPAEELPIARSVRQPIGVG